MVVVDTSVWAAYFNNQDVAAVEQLDTLLEDETAGVAVVPLIVTEVLQGFRTDTGFKRAEALLLRLPVLQPSMETHVGAAKLYRKLRKKGVTPRGAGDCIIAQTCIETGAELLTLDRDFTNIARQSDLKLAEI